MAPSGSVVNAALHVPEARVHVPSVVAPFLKVTVPVAAEGETVAVSVSVLPTAVLAAEAASVVVVAEVMVTLTAAEVLAA